MMHWYNQNFLSIDGSELEERLSLPTVQLTALARNHETDKAALGDRSQYTAKENPRSKTDNSNCIKRGQLHQNSGKRSDVCDKIISYSSRKHYHPTENDYMRKSLINSKAISVSNNFHKKIPTGLINSKKQQVRIKLQLLQICIFHF